LRGERSAAAAPATSTADVKQGPREGKTHVPEDLSGRELARLVELPLQQDPRGRDQSPWSAERGSPKKTRVSAKRGGDTPTIASKAARRAAPRTRGEGRARSRERHPATSSRQVCAQNQQREARRGRALAGRGSPRGRSPPQVAAREGGQAQTPKIGIRPVAQPACRQSNVRWTTKETRFRGRAAGRSRSPRVLRSAARGKTRNARNPRTSRGRPTGKPRWQPPTKRGAGEPRHAKPTPPPKNRGGVDEEKHGGAVGPA